MKKRSRSASKKPSAPEHRSILCVDPDASYADILRDAWSQLHLADELHVLNSRETALEFLGSACGENGQRPLAAVVLDPEATGEETGPFVREVRKHCGKATVKTDLCKGCGICEIICPEVFRMNGGRKDFAVVHSEAVPEEAENFCVDARDCCSPKAIQVVEAGPATPVMGAFAASL